MKIKKITVNLLVPLFFLTSFLIVILLNVDINNEKYYNLQNGTLDLSAYSFQNDEYLSLNKWEFYYNKLLVRADLPQNKPDLTAHVPDFWSNYSINNQKLSGFGYATYHLKIKTDVQNIPLAIKLDTIATSFKMYIDDKLVASAGVVGKEKGSYRPGYKPQIVTFVPEKKDFDIIIQVSNYIYPRSGIWYAIDFGSAQKLQKNYLNNIYKDTFIIGILFIMGVFYLCVFLFRPKARFSLFVSFVSFFTIVRVILYGSFIIFALFPNLSVYSYTFLDYFNLIWGMFSFNYLIISLFSSPVYKKILPAQLAFNILSTIILFVTPLSFYTKYLYVLEFVFLIFICISVYAMIRDWMKGSFDAMLVTLSSIIILICVMLDSLYQANLIGLKLGELNPIAFCFFTFVISLILAKNFAEALEKSAQLNLVLKEKLATEVAFLHAQIKPHFLFNTMSAIISISRTNIDKARQLMLDLSEFLRKSFDFNYKQIYTPLQNELGLVEKYVSIQKARFEDRFDVIYDIEENMDKKVPILMVQPLVENAILHGVMELERKGLIKVTAAQHDKCIRITVSDNGLGMTAEQRKQVFSGDANSKASGVGLKNIHERLIRLFGTGLVFDQNPDGGLSVCFEIPEDLE